MRLELAESQPEPQFWRTFVTFQPPCTGATLALSVAKKGQEKSTQARSSIRFPVHLPMAVIADAEEHKAETCDMSASAVRFNTDVEMAVGSKIEFVISIPAEVIGTSGNICVSGEGRVVRCSPERGKKTVAAIIDEYRFERR